MLAMGGAVLGFLLLAGAGCRKQRFEVDPGGKPSGPPIAASPSAVSAAAGAGISAGPPGQRPSVVVLRRRRGHLMALACYDDATRTLRSGDPCAALIPDGAEVRISDASTVRVRRVPPRTCRTPGGSAEHPAFALVDGPPGDAGPNPGPPLALWSSGPAPKLELPPSPPEPLPLPPSESNTIRSSTGNLLTAAPRPLLGEVLIDNVWTVDLDADGLRERLDQVRVLEQRGRFVLLAGVFVVAGKDAVALRPLRVQLIPTAERERLGRDDHSHDVKLLAAVDLDHDGRRELWLQVEQPGLTSDAVGRFTDTGLAVFAELTCHNDEPGATALPPPPVAAAAHPHIPR